MEVLIIVLAAFGASMLTFFSGFGLGTILAPVFAIFFPVDIAIALTGVVHFANNLFKLALVGKYANKTVLLRFGLPAILASFAGAWLLIRITSMPAVYQYEMGNKLYEITPVKLTIAILLIAFSLLEIVPAFQKVQFSKDKLPLGGLLSGFFGGLSGIQGAIRSAFLIKTGLSKESYIATGVVIACMVDISRLTVYASQFATARLHEYIPLLVSATLSAIAGAIIGKALLRKVTLRSIQLLVAVMLILISSALALGLI
ncbi:MAG: sulfite exporter TauE/SafE family protein [Bacteroidales bacterium]|nr:sulfite exporter TauE/SafE family protein [Bacteroidales bacterium]